MVRRLLSYASWMEYPVRLCFVRGKSSNIHKHKFVVTIREMFPYGREHLFLAILQGERTSVASGFPISWEWFFILLRMIFHLEPCEESGVVGSVQVRPAYNMKNAGIGSHLSDFFCFRYLWWTFLFGSLHLVFTVSLLSSSEGFDVQCVMVKEHEKAVPARVFYGLFLFYSMICTTFAHCMLWYA